MFRHRFASCLFGLLSLSLLVDLCCIAEVATASDAPVGFLPRVYRDDDGEHKFIVFVPRNYSPEKKWPVILFLHGAGERGSDGKAQTKVGLAPLVKKRQDNFPFLAVFPQCEDVKGRLLQGWAAQSPDGKRALKILDAVEKEFRVDKKREILTGWSMGGYGVWSIAEATPDRWAAIVPVAGGGKPEWAGKLKDTPVWAFHGADDTAILPDETRQMIEALKAAGGRPRFNVITGIGHDVWKAVYDSDTLYAWLLKPDAADQSAIAIHAKPGQRPLAEPDKGQPFVPALEIPKAGYVRLGNDMLDALAYSIPKSVPADLLTGKFDDLHDSTTVDGRNFSIVFSGIRYTGKLTQARVNAHRKDRLNIQLGLQDVTITVGGTYVTGRDHSATAGPIYVVIGSQRPAWLSFDVTPYVSDRKLRLKLVSTRFNIDNDNWYVTSPAGVSTRGLGMTRRKVSDGLVSGLYGSKGRIEREVASVVPSVMKRIEKRLDITDVTKFLSSFWPLPVYPPRIRVWPEQVATDDKGVSLVLGVTVAAVDPKLAPESPTVIDSIGRPVSAVAKTTNLRIGVALNLMRPLTDLLIQADVARIHVLDIPEKKFKLLADRNVLAEAIPDLKRHGKNVQIWSELILAEPVSVVDVEESSPGETKGDKNGRNGKKLASSKSDVADGKPQPTVARRFQLKLPKMLLSLAIKTDSNSAKWTPYAEFDIEVAQKAQAEISASGTTAKALKLGWFGAPDIKLTGRFSSGYKPKSSEMHVEKIEKVFVEGWRGWTSQGSLAKTDVPDIEFGLAKLELSKAGWLAPHLFVDFSPPGVKITNRSKVPLVYETKGPYSGWGGRYRLEPGKSHEYAIPYPLTYRRRTDAGIEMFTLPVGSHSEFRVPKTGGSPALFQAREKAPEEKQTPNKKESTDS